MDTTPLRGAAVVTKDDPELFGFLRRLLPFEAGGTVRADRQVGLVLADWLEEKGDPRAEDVRAVASFSLPEGKVVLRARRGRKGSWRWPGADDPAAPWWGLFAEAGPDSNTIYVRWHADPYTEVGRRILAQTGRYSGGHVYPRRHTPAAFDHCLGELIAALLGWSKWDLRKLQPR